MSDHQLTNNWITDPIILENTLVKLVPLASEHFSALQELAADKRIWEFYPVDGSDPSQFAAILEKAMAEKEKGTQYPFVIMDKRQNKLIGSTRYLDIQPLHRKLEIGFTWLHPDYWRSGLNIACKFLLLQHCFETLGTVRVQLKTDENNNRSRRAIEKIGGRFEGILRNDMIRANGTRRNSAYFSVIEQEWAEVKQLLNGL